MNSPQKSEELFFMDRLRQLDFRRQLSAEIHSRLQGAISQCVSSFLPYEELSHLKVQNKIKAQDPPPPKREGNRRINTERPRLCPKQETNNYPQGNFFKQYGLVENRIEQLTQIFKDNLHDWAEQIGDQSNRKSHFESDNLNYPHICPSCQLSDSNRNFIIQLLGDLGFLKLLKGSDRSFKTIVNQAQKVYFDLRSLHSFPLNSVFQVSSSHKQSCEQALQLKQNCCWEESKVKGNFTKQKKLKSGAQQQVADYILTFKQNLEKFLHQKPDSELTEGETHHIRGCSSLFSTHQTQYSASCRDLHFFNTESSEQSFFDPVISPKTTQKKSVSTEKVQASQLQTKNSNELLEKKQNVDCAFRAIVLNWEQQFKKNS